MLGLITILQLACATPTTPKPVGIGIWNYYGGTIAVTFSGTYNGTISCNVNSDAGGTASAGTLSWTASGNGHSWSSQSTNAAAGNNVTIEFSATGVETFTDN